ncbi:hypothetical protein LSH36_334g06001 [Paralvinella palmiformis]|uniref:5'-3' exoribonuclease n=1 Tax=Paralvinella palmiformis TaxID=53620 RepID=A0AAD9N0I0_9ANNE|nr:hypothetical protein LSH36_334g06001 [Paralvinella palmiformis]
MGVPAFFRWLSRKYPSIVVTCVEEKPKIVNDVRVPIDSSQPNPNDIEFDNLYLDMNGIIHPCCHPENKPPPKNEDEMMVLIFEYMDRLFSIVRPRRLLYMAIDGVAPRAKMNQQRSRRFRAAKETIEKREEITRIKDELRMKGISVPPDKPAEEHFDSNCITPGTPFMFRLADCLRFYVHDRLNNDPGWKDVKVILSDANVPGEGEHKIMDFIRRQRAQPDHDPNTHHCLCGADADLIMLGLATHEPNFTIIREEFKPNQPRPCEICGQIGHEMKECAGVAKEKQGEFDELPISIVEEQQFIFLRLNILREYLERELKMTNLPFEQDLERAIDDWVFMCFFVGNDFLPHLPSLEIREGAIDRLVNLYKKAVYKTGGYLTKNGIVNLERVQLVLSDLGEVEDEIFKKRREKDFASAERPSFLLGGQFAPKALGSAGDPVLNPRQAAAGMRAQSTNFSTSSNEEAAASLRSMLTNGSEAQGQKRKHEDDEEEAEPNDEVKLWEDGWKDRYYESKFAVGSEDIAFRQTVANEYVLGLCWVLLYYYQGCPSWKWYFPYHYAPFASDFINIADLNTEFEKDTEPFKPLEQLMGVFPAASKQHLPITWQDLMDNPESPIIDFYPTDFKIDLNGKKYAWQGVALLPFVDEKRLKQALEQVYPDLTPDEISRNIRGSDRLFVSKNHSAHDFLETLYEGTGTQEPLDVSTSLTQGLKGHVWCDEYAVLSGETVKSPLQELDDVPNNSAIAVKYQDPVYDPDFIFPAVILPGAKFPGRVLKEEDFNAMNRGGYRPQLGFQRGSHYRPKNSNSMQAAGRFVRGSMGGQATYGQVPPVRGLMGNAPRAHVPPYGQVRPVAGLMGSAPAAYSTRTSYVVTGSDYLKRDYHGISLPPPAPSSSFTDGDSPILFWGLNRRLERDGPRSDENLADFDDQFPVFECPTFGCKPHIESYSTRRWLTSSRGFTRFCFTERPSVVMVLSHPPGSVANDDDDG